MVLGYPTREEIAKLSAVINNDFMRFFDRAPKIGQKYTFTQYLE